jgi:hypothetical protein
MLKIKDGIDLKELEKFGFKYYPNPQYMYLESQYYDFSKIDLDIKKKEVKIGLSNIRIHCDDVESLDIDIRVLTESYIELRRKLEELIELGLVEKVSDDND